MIYISMRSFKIKNKLFPKVQIKIKRTSSLFNLKMKNLNKTRMVNNI